MKFLRYLFLILGCVVWAIGLSPDLYSKVSHAGWIQDGYHYGDLYRLSNLSQFKDPRKECVGYIRPTQAAASKKVHLYIIGDSFTEPQRVGKEDFVVDNYNYVHWDNFLHIKLDTTETNILMFESVERHLRQKMTAPINMLVPDTATFITKLQYPKVMQRLDDAFKADLAQDRLDGLLFQNDIFLTLKQWKADFARYTFGRVSKTVTLINDRDLVYYMDTDTAITSSFHDLKQPELDTVVHHINQSADIAKSLGFDQVILAVVPNKVSVLDPDYGLYNKLIERVYAHPNLQLPYVDVLSDFRRMGKNAYLNGDSHWTCEGRTVWLNKTNKLINSLASQPQL